MLGYALATAPQAPAAVRAGTDYIFLIDTSYSMLLDPELTGREGAGVEGASGGRDAAGRLVVRPPEPGQLRGGLLDKVAALVSAILLGAEEGATVAIYPFDRSIHDARQGELTEENREELAGYVTGIRATGDRTAIYDSVGQALRRIEELRKGSPPGRTAAVFLFTDGDENASKLSLDEILERYRLLRSEDKHYLFWRYIVTGGRAKFEQASKDRRALRLLDAAGVEVGDLAHLEKSFALERIQVRPARIDLGEVPGPGRRIVPVEIEAGARKKSARVHLSHFWRDGEGPPVHIENEWIEIPPGGGTIEVDLRLSVPGARPLGLFASPLSGVLRLTSSSVAVFDPPEIATGASLAPLRWPIGAAAALLSLLTGILLWGRAGRKVIVVASKSADRRRALMEALDSQGFDLTEAPDAEEARRFAARRAVRLVVTDLSLANGAGLLREIPVVEIPALRELDVPALLERVREALGKTAAVRARG